MARSTRKKNLAVAELDRKGGSDKPPEVTRDVPKAVQAILWGRAAGRCEFLGCNQPLWMSPVTKERVSIAQKAHIYAFSENGPRGNSGIDSNDLNGLDNLFLVCPACHLTIDRDPAGVRYTVAVLKDMKRRHERRVEIATGIDSKFRSHVVLYGANVGDHSCPRLMAEAGNAMFPDRYPHEATPISLGVVDSPTTDHLEEFWQMESSCLRSHFQRRVADRIRTGDIEHLSVFALAPQPLLIQLGTLLGDITPVDVYQRHREPQTWTWPVSAATPDFLVEIPDSFDGPPALVIALSATITHDRIEAVLGENARIWYVTVKMPHNDLIKSRDQLGRFRVLMRDTMNRIKAAHGQNTPLHIFPACSASTAVELGRIRMPKADVPWIVYDQVNARGGFVHALTITEGDFK